MIDPDDQLLTVPQVAEELQYRAATIRRWIAEGQLPAIRMKNREYRIRRGDVRELLGQAREKAPEPVTGSVSKFAPSSGVTPQ